MNLIKKNIPNAITCLNILSGCVAIIFAFYSYRIVGPLLGWQCAAIAIGVAAVADFLDGFSARLLHAYSELGKQLDSLSDLVSFGVAPAMLVFNRLHSAAFIPGWLPWCALLIPICGALRLAKFNIDTRQTTSFIGLPIPANAIFWIGFVALLSGSLPQLASPWWFIPTLIIESWLMVSPMRMFSLKFKNLNFKENFLRYILIIGALVLILCTGTAGLLWTIILYILLSLFSK